MTSPDISIVLNLHREAPYLSRTADSLVEAACYSKRSGLSFEAVIVLDRPDEATATGAGLVARRMERHMPVRMVEVDNGSLGPSRNDGIRQTRGRYVALADGDDLISFNLFDACYKTLQEREGKFLVIPEYLMAFGASAHVWKYHESAAIPPLMLVGENAYVSRIFAPRAAFDDLAFVDATGGRRAYEDWHFNVTALARGYGFICAPDAVLFYRQRPGSIMSNTRDKLIPWSEFFRPDVFTALCSSSPIEAGTAPVAQREPWEGIREQLRRSSVMLELTRAANRIDPGVDFGVLDHVLAGSNLNGSTNLGAAYLDVCRKVTAESYTDVLLVPHLNAGGAEKYILNVLRVLAADRPDFRLLVLSGEPSARHDWTDRLPAGSDFIDLHEIACRRDVADSTGMLALRIIQSVATGARLHLKPSGFANGFVSAFASELPGCKPVFYYFCEDMFTRRGVRFSSGGNFSFLSENGQHLHYVLSDHKALLDRVREKVPLPSGTARAIYAGVGRPQSAPARHIAKKLLWASRLHDQKRPSLLPLIARGLQAIDPAWQIDVYGSGEAETDLRRAIEGQKGIALKGRYSGFDMLPRDYAAFVYTAAYDGLPNVLLEAMAAGLPVVAPRVGGIGEVLCGGAGILLEDLVDDEAMAALYVDALMRLDRSGDRAGLIERADARLTERHRPEDFARHVLELFGETTP